MMTHSVVSASSRPDSDFVVGTIVADDSAAVVAVAMVEMVDVLPLGPGSKLAVVEFAGQRILVAVSRNGITRIADDAQGDFHVD